MHTQEESNLCRMTKKEEEWKICPWVGLPEASGNFWELQYPNLLLFPQYRIHFKYKRLFYLTVIELIFSQLPNFCIKRIALQWMGQITPVIMCDIFPKFQMQSNKSSCRYCALQTIGSNFKKCGINGANRFHLTVTTVDSKSKKNVQQRRRKDSVSVPLKSLSAAP